MKVFCINSVGWDYDKFYLWGLIGPVKKDCDGPKYGDTLTVANEYYAEGKLYYHLIEWPPCEGDNGFEAACFIPISEIEESVEATEHSIQQEK